MRPGDGLHFPVVAPHFVENGAQVSVSFSITFQTRDSADRQTLHRFNRKLRKLGLTPGNVSESVWGDQSKLSVLKLIRSAKHLFSDEESCRLAITASRIRSNPDAMLTQQASRKGSNL